VKSEKLFTRYLDKHPPMHRIDTDPHSDVELIIVIPAYRENELLPGTLASLCACDFPGVGVEIIVVINTSENDPEPVQKEQQTCEAMVRTITGSELPHWLQVHALPAYNLRAKHFGAGLARKTGLDEGIRRFHLLGRPQGILACLDADSPVTLNYMEEVTKWFSNPKHQGAAVNFEHPLEGKTYPPQVYEAITLYELHLRYYVQALRQTGFPYAFHTIGSTMVFRAEKYIQAGGMPKKQAGEDFYFLQKLIPLGGFGEIWDTRIMPSPRPSNRVIFGTGAAVTQHLNGARLQGETYPLQAFDDLKGLFGRISSLRNLPINDFEDWSYELSGPLRSFLLNNNFAGELAIIQANSSTPESFIKRFFGLFNAFKAVKYLNYAQAQFYAPMNLIEASVMLLERLEEETSGLFDPKSMTKRYRKYEREHPG
jgi:cellulose synthase/poly-beta-1,6-N-acetylglucosamine synthase-like glycosyltransferase